MKIHKNNGCKSAEALQKCEFFDILSIQITVWGCMSPWYECIELATDRVDASEYVRILKKCLLPKVEELAESEVECDYYFQQDNAPPHNAEVEFLFIL